MKKKQNNQLVKATKAVTPRKGTDVIKELVKELMIPTSAPTALVTPTAPTVDLGALLSAPLPSTPVTPTVSLLDSGNPNLNSRRIRVGTVIRTYRIANNQRKDSWSGGAKYYVQGGEIITDPESRRERFEVAVEYPYTDLYKAKVKKVALLATLQPSTEVIKIA